MSNFDSTIIRWTFLFYKRNVSKIFREYFEFGSLENAISENANTETHI